MGEADFNTDWLHLQARLVGRYDASQGSGNATPAEQCTRLHKQHRPSACMPISDFSEHLKGVRRSLSFAIHKV